MKGKISYVIGSLLSGLLLLFFIFAMSRSPIFIEYPAKNISLDNSAVVFNVIPQSPHADEMLSVIDSMIQMIDGRNAYYLDSPKDVDSLYQFLTSYMQGVQENCYWKGELDDIMIDDEILIAVDASLKKIEQENHRPELMNLTYLGLDSNGIKHFSRPVSMYVYDAVFDLSITIFIEGDLLQKTKHVSWNIQGVQGVLVTKIPVYPLVFDADKVLMEQ